MVGSGRLEKLIEVIGTLPRLALEVTLGGGNELLIGIVSLLVVVTLIIAGSDCAPLGLPLWPPLGAFGAPLHAFAGCLEWCPSAITGDRPPVALDENNPDCLLTRGVPGGNVYQLFRGLWLIPSELTHQGPTACAGPECRDDVSIIDLGELVAFLGEPSNVILEGFTRFLPATLQILGVSRLHICALEVAAEDPLEILLAINCASRQVVEPGPSRVGQVNGEK
jgi:hypothetical protein